MGKPRRRFVAKGVPGGWRIWNKKASKWWGDEYQVQPDGLVAELNGQKRPEELTKLNKKYRAAKR